MSTLKILKSQDSFNQNSIFEIISIPYFMENANVFITSDFLESIIKANHIFNNLLLTSKP